MNRIVSLLLAGCLAASSLAAQSSVWVSPEQRSPSLDRTLQEIDLGGEVFGFMDVNHDMETVVGFIDNAINEARNMFPDEADEIPPISVEMLAGELGLLGWGAIGISSVRNDVGFRNVTFVHVPGEYRGIMNMSAHEPAPFPSLDLAPAGADVVYDLRIDLTVALDIARSIMTEMGAYGPLEELDRALNQPLPLPGVFVRDIVAELDTRIMVYGTLDPVETMQLPNVPFPLPRMDLTISVDNLGWLIDSIAPMAAGNPMVEYVEEGSLRILRPADGVPLPPGFEYYRPALFGDIDTGRLMITARQDYILDVVNGAPAISADEAFNAQMVDLPREGNSLVYISAEYTEIMNSIFLNSMRAEADPNLEPFLPYIERYMNALGTAQAAVSVNRGDGWVSIANQDQSYKMVALVPIVMGAGIGAAVAIPAYERMQENQARGELDEAASVVANAAATYMLEMGATSVTITQLEEEGFFWGFWGGVRAGEDELIEQSDVAGESSFTLSHPDVDSGYDVHYDIEGTYLY